MALLDTMKQIRSIADERTMAGPSDRLPMGVDKRQRYKEAFMKLDQEFKENRRRAEEAKERNMVAANAMMNHEQREMQRKQGQAPQGQAPQGQMQGAMQPQASGAMQGQAPQQPQRRQIRPLIGG